MTLKRLLLSLLLLAVAVVIPAQDRSTPSITVEGVIKDSTTGKALPNASVSLTVERGFTTPSAIESTLWGSSSLTSFKKTQTDKEGKFRFNAVPGRYVLLANVIGYASLRRSAGIAVTITDGEAVRDIEILLSPTASITGRIIDERGNPIPGAVVVAVRRGYVDGSVAIFDRGAVSMAPFGINPVDDGIRVLTNDRGEYRLFNLQPGEHYVAIGGRSADRTSVTTPEYYPGVVEADKAKPIILQPGVTVSGIDFQVLRPAGHVARFAVVPPTVAPFDCSPSSNRFLATVPEQIEFALVRHDHGMEVLQYKLSGSPRLPESLAFKFLPNQIWTTPPLPPGSYEILHNPCRSMFGLNGRLAFTIAGSDVDAGTLIVDPNVRIDGRIRNTTGASVDLKALQVRLRPTDSRRYGFYPAIGRVDRDGNITFLASGRDSVAAGTYFVDVMGLPNQLYVSSMRYRDGELPDANLTVENGVAGSLTITIASPGGSIAGTVRDEQGVIVKNAQVVLIPEASLARNLSLFKDTLTDQHGTFVIDGVVPGVYRAIAWEDVEPGAWKSPAFLKAVQDRGTELRLEAGVPRDVSLRVTQPRSIKASLK